MKTTKKLKQNKRSSPPASEAPVTRRMLYAVRNELKSDVASVQMELKATRIDLKAAVESSEQRINAQLESLKATLHHMHLMYEDQNAKNNIVLDGLAGLFHRQDRLEGRMDRLERPKP